MGPYYLTAFTTLLGPVRRVCGSARISFPEREIKSEPLAGKIIEVETPSHIAAVLDFEAGPVISLVTSFDVQAHGLPAHGDLWLGSNPLAPGSEHLRRSGSDPPPQRVTGWKSRWSRGMPKTAGDSEFLTSLPRQNGEKPAPYRRYRADRCAAS